MGFPLLLRNEADLKTILGLSFYLGWTWTHLNPRLIQFPTNQKEMSQCIWMLYLFAGLMLTQCKQAKVETLARLQWPNTFVSFRGLLVRCIIHWHRWHPDPVFGSRDHPRPRSRFKRWNGNCRNPQLRLRPMFMFRVPVWFVLDMSSMLISTRLFFEQTYVSCDVAWSCTFRHVVL